MDLDLEIPGPFGRIHAVRHGPSDGPLVLGLHGLTGTHEQLAGIGISVGASGFQFVALDLRGRGASERTPRGTYGWASHAHDVIAVADSLGAERFAIVGVSMGGSVAMTTAELAGPRVAALVLVDIAGRVDPGVGPVVAAALAAADPGRADPSAVAEDRSYTRSQDPYERWKYLTMPTLLVRAMREIEPGAGHVVPASDRDLFATTVPDATIVEVDATHLTIADTETTAVAITDFLTSSWRGP